MHACTASDTLTSDSEMLSVTPEAVTFNNVQLGQVRTPANGAFGGGGLVTRMDNQLMSQQ